MSTIVFMLVNLVLVMRPLADHVYYVGMVSKGTLLFLFAFIAAAVVQCGGRKTSPRTSTILQFIFYFWSFEISVNILRNQK